MGISFVVAIVSGIAFALTVAWMRSYVPPLRLLVVIGLGGAFVSSCYVTAGLVLGLALRGVPAFRFAIEPEMIFVELPLFFLGAVSSILAMYLILEEGARDRVLNEGRSDGRERGHRSENS